MGGIFPISVLEMLSLGTGENRACVLLRCYPQVGAALCIFGDPTDRLGGEASPGEVTE